MTSPREEKRKIAITIVGVLEKNKLASRKALVASLKLESGFTDKVIQDIINDLISIGKIRAAGDELRAPEKEC